MKKFRKYVANALKKVLATPAIKRLKTAQTFKCNTTSAPPTRKLKTSSRACTPTILSNRKFSTHFRPRPNRKRNSAFQMLKSCRQLSMTVRSPGGGWAPRQTCSWMDRQGRPVSPPLEYQRPPPALPPAPPAPRYPPYGSRSTSKDRSIRRVISMFF